MCDMMNNLKMLSKEKCGREATGLGGRRVIILKRGATVAALDGAA